jgi:hypothetical protein
MPFYRMIVTVPLLILPSTLLAAILWFDRTFWQVTHVNSFILVLTKNVVK